jgi:putative ABC transport system permease protein
MKDFDGTNPWQTLDNRPSDSVIYGIADQTVLQYGLKIKPGDTLTIKAESGQVINLVISAGLKSSVFQGFVLIGMDNFNRFFPSVSGSQVFLADGDRASSQLYIRTLSERLRDYGAHFEPAADRLASFFVVTNTYLRVFTILSGIGMILGVAGLGLILLRNFNQRKRDFGLMIAEGYSIRIIRRVVLREHILVLFAGIVTGAVSAIVATRPSLLSDTALPWKTITVMIMLVIITGLTALILSTRAISKENLITRIRKE